MKKLVSLIARHAIDARMSLIVAPLTSAAVLCAIHVWFPKPSSVSEAAAWACAVLAALWSLYFASDAFASDAANGRLATQALLPVRPMSLWLARVLFVVFAVLAQIAALLVIEYGLQLSVGDANSLAFFESRLADLLPWSFALIALCSVAMFASLLVENALAAMIGSILLIGALSAVATPFVQGLALVGIDVNAVSVIAIVSCGTALFFASGAFGFVRGQRRLGARSVRVIGSVAPVVACLVFAGVATAAVIVRRVSVELENPRAQFSHACSSADGRFLALPVVFDLPGNEDPPPVVWLLDVDTGARECVARPGWLEDDRYAHTSLAWDAQQPLRIMRTSLFDARELTEIVEVHVEDSGWRVASLSGESIGVEDLLATRVIPEWARIETKRGAGKARETIVHWDERELAAKFMGTFLETCPALAVLPTAEPGRLLVLRDGAVVLHEMESASERSVLEIESIGFMDPSPTGSAVLVHDERGTYALDALTGEPLHAPWPRGVENVRWIDSSDSARVVEVAPVGVRLGATTVLDLDTGASFAIERDHSQRLLHRIGSRGYVFVRADGDLVWVDTNGALVKVLVDRPERRYGY